MDYFVALCSGVAIGVLMAYATVPVRRLVPFLCASVLMLAAIVALTSMESHGSWCGLTFGVTSLVARLLAEPFFWARHPLLEGAGYRRRLWFSLRMNRQLRETFDRDDLISETER